MSFLLSNKNYYISLIILFLFYFISRILFIEWDIPNWRIGYYQSIDEFYYTLGAFNLYHYNDYDIKLIDYIDEPKYVTNYFMEVIVAISLKLFGNNYYGLRISSVFAGALTLFIIYKLLTNYVNNKQISRWYIILFLFYMVLDFSFNLANRIAEPTMFRILAFVLMFYFTLKITDNGITFRKSLLLGFFATASFLLVYLTNLFIVATVGLYIIYISYQNQKNIFLNSLSYILGVVLFIISFLIFYNYFFNSNWINDFIQTLDVFSNRVSNYYLNFQNILLANTFKFNIGFLYLSAVSLILFLYLILYKKDNFSILLFFSFVVFILQTIFINDYPQRKLIFIFPILILIIFIVFYNIKFIQYKLNSNKVMKYIIYFLIFISLYHLTLLYKIVVGIDTSSYISLIISLIIIIYLLGYKLFKCILIFCIILFFLPNIFFNYKYIYSNPEFKYKNVMKNLDSSISGKYTVGWSHAFRLYNRSIPLMSPYFYNYYNKGNIEGYKQKLLEDKNVLYQFTLEKPNTNRDVILFDINEVTKDLIGFEKLEMLR